MSSEWPQVAVEEVCELIVDCVNKTAPVVPEPTPYRMIRTTNVRHGRIDLSECRFVERSTYETWTRRARLQPGDVVLTREAPIGEVGMVTEAEGVFLGQRLMQYRANQALLDPRFLLYTFLSPSLQHQFGSHEGSGSVVSHIRVGDCFKFKLALPPLPVQAEIASLLGALDDRITLLRETNATLEAIAQALFKSWFVDFDPVRAKMEGRVPEGMDEATAALFPNALVESELGLIPQGWTVQAVGSLLVPKRGKSITRSKCVEGEIPVVAGGLDPAYFHNQSNVSSPVVTISASGANAGFVRLYQQDIWASDCSFVGSEQTDSIYFWYVFLKTNQEKIYFMQQGAAQPHIYPSDLMRLTICTPLSKELRVSFNSLVSTLFEKIERSDKLATTLTQVRDSLLPRLISGKLRLPEALEEATQ